MSFSNDSLSFLLTTANLYILLSHTEFLNYLALVHISSALIPVLFFIISYPTSPTYTVMLMTLKCISLSSLILCYLKIMLSAPSSLAFQYPFLAPLQQVAHQCTRTESLVIRTQQLSKVQVDGISVGELGIPSSKEVGILFLGSITPFLCQPR